MGRLTQFIDTLRTEGPRRAVVKAGAATCCSRLIVLEFDLDQLAASPRADPNRDEGSSVPNAVTVSQLTASDADDYAAMHPNARFDLLRMLATDRVGFGSRLGGQLVAVHWAAFGTVFVPYLHRSLTLATDEALMEGAFVPPEFRGRGLAGVDTRLRKTLLRDAGVRCMIALIQPENSASLRMTEKLGYRRTVTLYAVGIGRYRRTFPIGRRDDRRDARRLLR